MAKKYILAKQTILYLKGDLMRIPNPVLKTFSDVVLGHNDAIKLTHFCHFYYFLHKKRLEIHFDDTKSHFGQTNYTLSQRKFNEDSKSGTKNTIRCCLYVIMTS